MSDTTYDGIENFVYENVTKLGSMNPTDEGYKELSSVVNQMTGHLLQIEKDYEESEDRKEKLRIEEAKNNNMVLIEENRNKFDWKQAGFDLVKIVVPLIIGYSAYFIAQDNVLHLEEHGSMKTFAGRTLSIPNPFSKLTK